MDQDMMPSAAYMERKGRAMWLRNSPWAALYFAKCLVHGPAGEATMPFHRGMHTKRMNKPA